MVKRLELEAIRADLSAVEALLAARTEQQDPVGWFQFNQRRGELEDRLAELKAETAGMAVVALYFGGRPVIGSKGILADFGGRAVENFQSLVSTRFAAVEQAGRPLGGRGPIPLREHSALMITEVAHGSFGFVLEEASSGSAQPTMSLKHVVDEVCDLIHDVASEDESDQDDPDDAVPEALDRRVLDRLKDFFRLLDESGATVRIVEDRRDFSLRPEMISRAKERIETMNVEERSEQVEGRLYLLPEGRRFELQPIGGAPTLKGTVAADVFAVDVDAPLRVIGQIVKTTLRVRELRYQQQPAGRRSYQLVKIETDASAFRAPHLTP